MASNNNKKPEKVRVKLRSQSKKSSADGYQLNLARIINWGERIIKIKNFLNSAKLKKAVELFSVMMAPVIIMSLLMPFILKVVGNFLLGLGVPGQIAKLMIYLVTIALVPYLVSFIIKFYGWPKDQIIKLSKLKFRSIPSILLALVGYIMVSGLMFYVVTKLKLVPENLITEAQNIGFSAEHNIINLVQVFIAVAIVPPVVEELLFRGLSFLNLRRLISFWPAAIFSSLLFAFYHGQFNVGLDTFILGLFMAWAVEKTDSLWASIIIHFIKNSIAFFILFVR
jgi:membrane protease YdiL (CAAX protease family)